MKIFIVSSMSVNHNESESSLHDPVLKNSLREAQEFIENEIKEMRDSGLEFEEEFYPELNEYVIDFGNDAYITYKITEA